MATAKGMWNDLISCHLLWNNEGRLFDVSRAHPRLPCHHVVYLHAIVMTGFCFFLLDFFQTWYVKTPLGKKRLKASLGDEDGDKKGKKGGKGKKSGKKGKKKK